MGASLSLTEIATTFLRLAASGDVDPAYGRFVGERFRHHNPYFRGDAGALKAAMRENALQNPSKTFEVLRTVADGDLVAVHSRIRMQPGGRPIAVVHLFRFERGKIAELWDVGQAEPDALVNEHGMF